MAEDGKIIYKVEVNSDDAVSEAKRGGERAGQALSESAERHGGKFEQVMIGAARRIGEAFVDMAARAVKGVEQIAQAGVEFNAKMETYQTAFTTLLGTEEEAARVMEQIRKDAAATPFDVDSLTQANQMLIAAGVSAGDARNDVLSLANAIAATGGGSAELSRMAANMQQIKNVGKATAMDIRQFANAGINIYGLLADYTGKTVEEVSELDVSYEMLAGALAHASAEGGKYAGAMEKQSQTFTGRISTLKDNATQLAGALTEDLFNTLSGEALPKVMEWVSTLLEAAQTGGLDGALSAAKTILGGLVQSFLEGLPQMLDTGLTLLTGLLEGIASAIPEIIPVITQVIIAIITALATHLPEILTAGMDILTGIITGLINAMPLIVQAIPQIIAALVTAIINNLPQLVTAGMNLLVALIKGILTALPQLLELWPQIISAIYQAFTQTDWASIGSNIVTGIWNGITGLWHWLEQSVWDAVGNLWQRAKDALGIASPSKKFKYIGEMSVKGTEVGFEENEDELTRTVRTIYSNMADEALDNVIQFPAPFSTPDYSGMDAIERNVSFNLAATGTTGETVITVPLYINDREFARATAWDMGEQLAWREV